MMLEDLLKEDSENGQSKNRLSKQYHITQYHHSYPWATHLMENHHTAAPLTYEERIKLARVRLKLPETARVKLIPGKSFDLSTLKVACNIPNSKTFTIIKFVKQGSCRP
jgi:hypothetical protein